MLLWLLSPSCLSRLGRNLGALFGRERCRLSDAALDAPQVPQRYGVRVLGLGGGCELRSLAGGLKHDLEGEFVRIARAGVL